MLSILSGLLSSLSYATSDLFSQNVTRQTRVLTQMVWVLATGVVAIVPIALLVDGLPQGEAQWRAAGHLPQRYAPRHPAGRPSHRQHPRAQEPPWACHRSRPSRTGRGSAAHHRLFHRPAHAGRRNDDAVRHVRSAAGLRRPARTSQAPAVGWGRLHPCRREPAGRHWVGRDRNDWRSSARCASAGLTPWI